MVYSCVTFQLEVWWYLDSSYFTDSTWKCGFIVNRKILHDQIVQSKQGSLPVRSPVKTSDCRFTLQQLRGKLHVQLYLMGECEKKKGVSASGRGKRLCNERGVENNCVWSHTIASTKPSKEGCDFFVWASGVKSASARAEPKSGSVR